ncbi:hypothetical protein [Streptomyces sp. MZ04]|uniref:hypothetical protein n=1 Tax=Streptomyces sp. MZ04 TaxID=2559236 RepID=UPI00107E7B9A|nr:hypothetical protein [Streptomyces sp. MZ04]TGA97300.1 hypothetical protein E2651_31595 [Streptomyces sp. MZ04]
MKHAARRTATILVAAAAAAAVAAPSAGAMEATLKLSDTTQAASAQAPAKGKLTVGKYVSYLKKQRMTKTLKAFQALPKNKQADFVKQLQDRRVLKAFAGVQASKTKSHVKQTVRYNKAVSFVKETTVKRGVKARGWNTKMTSNFTERIYNIPVTSTTTFIKYQAKKNPTVKDVGAKVTNVNAAFGIRVADTEPDTRGQKVKLTAAVVATPKYRSAGKAALVKDHSVTGTAKAAFTSRLANR